MREIADLLLQSDQITSAVARMQSARLVRRIGSSDSQLIDTYHDKIRETVLDSLSERRSRELHLRFGEYMEGRFTSVDSQGARHASDDRVFDLARHFSQAADPRAFNYYLQAGTDSLRLFAMDVAAQHLRHACRLCPDDLSAEVLYRLHNGYGRALLACNQNDAAIEQFRLAIQYASQRFERGACLLRIGEAEWKMSRFSQSEKSTAMAFAEVSERNPRTDFGRIVLGLSYLAAFFFVPSFFYFRLKRLNSDEVRFLSQAHSAMWWQLDINHLSYYLFHEARGSLIAKTSHEEEVRRTAFGSMGAFLSLAGAWPVAAWMIWRFRRGYDPNNFRATLGIAELHQMTYAYSAGRHGEVYTHYRVASEELGRSGSYLSSAADHFTWHSHSITGNVARQIYHARQEILVAHQSNDQIIEAFGKYGLAEGLARVGRVAEGRRLAAESVDILEKIGSWTETIARVQYSKVLIQDSDYATAVKEAKTAVSDCWKLRLIELTVPAFPLFVEANCGSDWYSPDQDRVRENVRGVGGIALIGRFIGYIFPNIRAHSLRVSGRRAQANGRRVRARKYFDMAVQSAEKIGANYEHARALIDKSMLDYPEAKADRQRGLDLLESLGCVLPEAEVEYLGIDREAHHARAAEARARNEAELEAAGK